MKTLARQRDKAEILGRLRRLGPDRVRLWGRMSVHQMVCHLADSFRMALGLMPVSPIGGLLRQAVIKGVALYVPLRWPPGRIATRPEIDQEVEGTRPSDFAADLAQVASLVEAVTAATRTLDRQRHPVFGAMSDAAWLRWAYLHTDHHLRQFGV
jgi:hypothetical protein